MVGCEVYVDGNEVVDGDENVDDDWDDISSITLNIFRLNNLILSVLKCSTSGIKLIKSS